MSNKAQELKNTNDIEAIKSELKTVTNMVLSNNTTLSSAVTSVSALSKEDISLDDLKTIIGVITGTIKSPSDEQLELVKSKKDYRITLEQATLVSDAISSERSAVASSVLKQVVEALALHRELLAKLGITDEDVDEVSKKSTKTNVSDSKVKPLSPKKNHGNKRK